MSQRLTCIEDLLRRYQRVAIVGGPKTGKTTLAKECSASIVVHTDDYMHFAWNDFPIAIIQKCNELGSFLVEGVQVPRALRKGLRIDAVVYLDEVKAVQNDGQKSMTKAIATVFEEWQRENRATPIYSPDMVTPR